ncbi:unnamed protein product, partial [Brenthis ino]
MADSEYKKVPIVENGKDQDLDEEFTTYGYGVRHIQAVLVFLCLTLGYATRAHLGVTIVAMTKVNSEQTNTEHSSLYESTTLTNLVSSESFQNFTSSNDENSTIIYETVTSSVHTTFDWPKSVQEIVLGGFFLGYSVMMFPMGIVSQRWGGKIPLQVAMALNAILSFFSPWLIAWGDWKVLCAIRVIQGFSQAGLYPSIMRFVANWIPLSERASLSAYIYTGSLFGTVVAFQLAGILAFSQFGWPSTFWALGIGCFIVFVLITVFGATTPLEHKFISEAEKKFIMGKLKNDCENKGKIPWKSIFTSVPAWATFSTHIGSATCFTFMFVQVPTYMSSILKLNIRNSGILSSLPYIAAFSTSIAFGFFSDFFTNRKMISVKNARRISNSISCCGPALCLALVSYTTNTAVAVVCFIVSMAANAALHTGWMVNYVDLSPNYGGALMATGNTLSGLFFVFLPVVVSNIVTDVTNVYQWRIIMFLMAGMTTLCNLIFVTFMSADVQPWNDSEYSKAEPEELKLKPEEKSEKGDILKE